MFAKFTGAKEIGLRSYHHVNLDKEFKNDCGVWVTFLSTKIPRQGISRPFIDFLEVEQTAETICLYSDATANENLGLGVFYKYSKWMFQQWEPGFIRKTNPFIEFLELFAVCVGVFTWSQDLQNCHFILFCDNKSVCDMIRNTSSGCRYCMTLIRKLVLKGLQYNFRVFAFHVKGSGNYLSNSLSRLQIKDFWKFARKDGLLPEPNPTKLQVPELWPLSQYWENNCASL